MINVNFMKPFYTKVSGDKLRIVFAYQYLSIEKDNELYHFIPIEGKELIFDLKIGQVSNLHEVFAFQRGNKFIRLPLYQLLLVSNFNDFLIPIIDRSVESYNKSNNVESYKHSDNDSDSDSDLDKDFKKELLLELKKKNYTVAIDIALDNKDEKTFYRLTKELNELNKVS